MEVPTDKGSLRRWAGDRRRHLTIESDAVVAGLRAFLRQHDLGDGWVLTYRPMAGEIDLDPLLTEQRCAVTRTRPGGVLTVHPADAPTERHRYGYLQPVADAPLVPVEEIAVVLVPGALFDRHGHRLGHGMGYYDRLLARLAPEVPRVGVVPAALVIDDLPVEPHDITMTHLATEAGVTSIRSR